MTCHMNKNHVTVQKGEHSGRTPAHLCVVIAFNSRSDFSTKFSICLKSYRKSNSSDRIHMYLLLRARPQSLTPLTFAHLLPSSILSYSFSADSTYSTLKSRSLRCAIPVPKTLSRVEVSAASPVSPYTQDIYNPHRPVKCRILSRR